MARKRQNKDRGNVDDDASKGTTANESQTPMTFDDYICSGNVEVDFPALCELLGINALSVHIRHPAIATTQPDGETTEENTLPVNATYSFKPCVEVEMGKENSFNVKFLKVFGWRMNQEIFRVLQKTLPSMKQLHNIQFWKAGLTDQMLITLTDTMSLCSNLRVVTLEGNSLPEQSFHLLLSESSILTHLFLLNNQIGDEGCRLIGSALSTPRSSNTNLLSLNLAFNSIGDAGAAHIAQGLRLNRTLRFLSLSNNRIGDAGAAHLAAIFSEMSLTHEEVVERRRLLLEKAQSMLHRVDSDPSSSVDQLVSSSSSIGVSKGTSKKKEVFKKEEKSAANKETKKSSKKSSDLKKTPRSKGGRKQQCESEEKSQPVAEAVEIVHPLLEESVYPKHGQLLMPGNKTLIYLNLAGNMMTEKSLSHFLALLENNNEGSSLSCLCLQRNCFPQQCESYEKIVQLMQLKTSTNEQPADEGQGA